MARHACEQLTLAEQIRRNLANPVRVSLHGISCDVKNVIDETCLVSHILLKSADALNSDRIAAASLSEESSHADLWPLHYVYTKSRSGFGLRHDGVEVKSSDPQEIVNGLGSVDIERLVVFMVRNKYIMYGDRFICVEFKYDVFTDCVHATRYENHCSFKLDRILVDGNIKGELLMREIVSGLSS